MRNSPWAPTKPRQVKTEAEFGGHKCMLRRVGKRPITPLKALLPAVSACYQGRK